MNTDKSNLINKSKQYVQAVLNGDFDIIISNMNEGSEAQRKASILEQSWISITKELGECKGILSTNHKEVQGKDFVIVMLDYDTLALKVTFSFDQSGKISNLSALYAPLPSEQVEALQSDKFNRTSVQIGDSKYSLDGELVIPKSSTDVPAVILVHGSGSHDMNETFGGAGNTPFADLAHGLAERGIASIRYNKRYFQYPQTVPERVTVWDEVINDVNAAIELARKTDGIDKNQIFIIGHSLGGMLSPEIAKENPDLAGFVSLGGSPRKLEDIILDQNKAAISAMNNTDEDKQAVLDTVIKMVGQVKALTSEGPHETILSLNSEYWLSLKETNPQNFVNTLTVPMLFLQGDADFQVSPEKDFALWKAILKKNKNVKFKLYPGLNHFFIKSSGKMNLSDYNTKAQVEEQVIVDIAQWIYFICSNEDVIRNHEFSEARKNLLSQFDKNGNVVLSTSLNDVVTSRTVTVIPFNNALYFTSIKRPGAVKMAQIEKNPNVAICVNTTQITGVASILGLVSAEENSEVMAIYKEKLPESYERFAVIPSCVVIKVELTTSKSWKVVDNKIETTTIDFINGTITKNII